MGWSEIGRQASHVQTLLRYLRETREGETDQKRGGLDSHNPIVTLKKKRREPSAAAPPKPCLETSSAVPPSWVITPPPRCAGVKKQSEKGGERSILIHSTITNTASSMFSWLGSGLWFRFVPPPFATSCDSYEAGVSPSP